MQKINWSDRDRFRAQFAILAKHVLCQRSHLKLFQIERSIYCKMVMSQASSVGNYIGSSFLKSQRGLKLISKATEIGKAIIQKTPMSAFILLGVSLSAALVNYQYQNPQIKQTSVVNLKKNSILEEKKQIQSYLRAYLKCYENKQTFQHFFHKSLQLKKEKKSNLYQSMKSVSQIQNLIEKKNYIYFTIIGQQFSIFAIDQKIKLVQLYYQLSKALIQITALIFSKQLNNFIPYLKEEHEKIKQKMIQQICRCINKGIMNTTVTINGITTVCFEDPNNYCHEIPFSKSIFIQLFKCSETGYKIDDIYQTDCWTCSFSGKVENIQVDIQKYPIYKYIGSSQQAYLSYKKKQNSRIRIVTYDKYNNDWACYFEDLNNKAGSHEINWNSDKKSDCIEFDKVKVIFVNLKKTSIFEYQKLTGKLSILNDKYKVVDVFQKQGFPICNPSYNYCVELNRQQILTQIHFSSVLDIRFKFEYNSSSNNRTYKQTCEGTIATLNNRYRLGFGKKWKWVLHLSLGYNFHLTDTSDNSQRLIFQAITPISYFENIEPPEIKSFYCRIKNCQDRTMYMVRDSRSSSYGDFGNNTTGGELIRIDFTDRLSEQNEYYGTIQVEGCQLTLAWNSRLLWEKRQFPLAQRQKFQIYFEQKK